MALPSSGCSSASPVPPSFTLRSSLSPGPLEWPFYLASLDKLPIPNLFFPPLFFPKEMCMGFEASKAVGSTKEAFRNCSVFFFPYFVSFACTFSLEALLRACLGPKLWWEGHVGVAGVCVPGCGGSGGRQNVNCLVSIPRRTHRPFPPLLNKVPMPKLYHFVLKQI